MAPTIVNGTGWRCIAGVGRLCVLVARIHRHWKRQLYLPGQATEHGVIASKRWRRRELAVIVQLIDGECRASASPRCRAHGRAAMLPPSRPTVGARAGRLLVAVGTPHAEGRWMPPSTVRPEGGELPLNPLFRHQIGDVAADHPIRNTAAVAKPTLDECSASAGKSLRGR